MAIFLVLCILIKNFTIMRKIGQPATYVIMVSQRFPLGHIREGQETGFEEKILSGEKIHTIRANTAIWKKRVDKVKKGKAVIELRRWEGAPYRSKQILIKRLTHEDGVGFQEVLLSRKIEGMTARVLEDKAARNISLYTLAKNDGLDTASYISWFSHYDLSQPLGIIHFTSKRY